MTLVDRILKDEIVLFTDYKLFMTGLKSELRELKRKSEELDNINSILHNTDFQTNPNCSCKIYSVPVVYTPIIEKKYQEMKQMFEKMRDENISLSKSYEDVKHECMHYGDMVTSLGKGMAYNHLWNSYYMLTEEKKDMQQRIETQRKHTLTQANRINDLEIRNKQLENVINNQKDIIKNLTKDNLELGEKNTELNKQIEILSEKKISKIEVTLKLDASKIEEIKKRCDLIYYTNQLENIHPFIGVATVPITHNHIPGNIFPCNRDEIINIVDERIKKMIYDANIRR